MSSNLRKTGVSKNMRLQERALVMSVLSYFCNWYKRINFTFVSLREGSAEYHALLYMYELSFIREGKLDRG